MQWVRLVSADVSCSSSEAISENAATVTIIGGMPTWAQGAWVPPWLGARGQVLDPHRAIDHEHPQRRPVALLPSCSCLVKQVLHDRRLPVVMCHAQLSMSPA